MENFLFNETIVIQYLKMKGVIPLFWKFAKIKTCEKITEGIYMRIESKHKEEIFKTSYCFPNSELDKISFPKEFQLSIPKIIERVNKNQKFFEIPSNAAVGITTNEFSIEESKRDCFGLSFYSKSELTPYIEFMSYEELISFKKSNK